MSSGELREKIQSRNHKQQISARIVSQFINSPVLSTMLCIFGCGFMAVIIHIQILYFSAKQRIAIMKMHRCCKLWHLHSHFISVYR